ncbi:MAG: bifunctional glycosyltransferase/class I SAM-dependent methyltransferase [bacterium]
MDTTFDSKGQRIGIFVIAYDAESHIEKTLGRIPDDVWEAITVVYIIDDCSKDETVERALSFERWKEKIVVLRNRVNQRYGGNQKLGYQYAIDQNLDIVVMLHADGQYAPECLSLLLGPAVDGADVVIGSRMFERGAARKGGMPKYKYVGNIILTKIENALSGMNLSEFHSGYRAYRTSFLRNVPFWENSDEWHFDTQILFQAAGRGARISEVGIPTYYGDELCHVNGMAYSLNCVVSAITVFLYRRRLFYSRYLDVDIKGRRYFEKFNDPASSHSIILQRLKQIGVEGKRILELGVGDASLTRRLHEMGAILDGIEIDDLSAELAKPYCRRVLKNDLDDMDQVPLDEPYDIIIAADVLEHLRNPEYVLSRLKRYCKVGGILVVSLPNIANLYVRLNLLFGRFPLHRKGLLDRTHLHCYTLRSAASMLTRTGWIIEQEAVTAIPFGIVFPFLERGIWRPFLALFRMFTRVFRGLLAYQGVFFCYNPNKARLL